MVWRYAYFLLPLQRKTKIYFIVKALRYILLLLLIGLYACEVPEKESSYHLEQIGGVSSAINDISNEYANRLQQQYDWTEAITSYQLSSNNQENRLRTRRHQRIANSWQLRTNTQQQYAALQYQASSLSHSINRIVALSRTLSLNLPTEHISFPFHSFW